MSKAGLFSAVVTTFVVQTSQSLQPDYAAMSASLLYESVLVQRAIANGSSVDSIAPSPLNPTIAFVPATTDVWVNGLWFVSLFLSLTTALVAVLVKQWLYHYVALPSGTPRDRSLTRQFRYAGFQKWHVQVVIGLLPVLMHLALAIFLGGLVIFLQPLREALSWIICAGTILVYTAYVVATILPILFLQCPYRTPLCDLVYISLCRTIPRVTWENKEYFLNACRRRNLTFMFHNLPCVEARTIQSLAMIESEFVQQTSNNLAVEALHWLFSVSSNPSIQSIVVQSVGGLPMTSGSMVILFLGPEGSGLPMLDLRESLIGQCLLETKASDVSYYKPVPGMELKLGRLLRFPKTSFLPGYLHHSFIYTPDVYSFELTTAILSNGGTLHDKETLNESITSSAFLMDNTRSKLSPGCWYSLMWRDDYKVLRPLDPNDANMFPLHLCSAILKSFGRSPVQLVGLTQEVDSPSVLDFEDALAYFIDKIYDELLSMFFESKDQSSVDELSSLKSLRVLVLAIKFLLDRLSLPNYETSHTTILESLIVVTERIQEQGLQEYTFLSTEEATVVMPVLEDIIAHCLVPPPNIDSDPGQGLGELWKPTLLAYDTLTRTAPSACSLHGLQSTVDLMTRHWDQTAKDSSYRSAEACRVLTTALEKCIPVAFTVFHENKCLEFLENHVFLPYSVDFVSAYVAGVFAMQCESDVDAATHQPHIDYLHNPDNLFTACSILAINDIITWNSDIHRNIMTLAKLRPRDTAWDECRRKLHDLVQLENDGIVDFLGKGWPNGIGLKEIQVAKDNITYAVHVLDDFLDGGAPTIMVS